MVNVVKVENKKQLDTFIKYPFKLYQDNPYWVPPLIVDEKFTLNKDKNPAFEYCKAQLWLAYRDGEVVGRIAGIINYSYNKKWDKKYARFGWVDYIDDYEVSKALFDTVETWAEENGLNGVHGPLGFCDLDKQGMLVEGFDEIGSFITIYNYPYYMKHIEACGYKKDVDWIEVDIDVPETHDEKTKKIAAMSQKVKEKYGLTVKQFKHRKELLPLAPAIFDLLNEAYKDLYGVVTITDKQVKTYVEQFFSFVNLDYICIITDSKDELAGFAINIPSLSKACQKSKGRLFPFGFINFLRAIKKNDTLDLYLVAIRPGLQTKGLPYIMLDEMYKSAIKNRITRAIASPELETNRAVQSLWRSYDSRILRRRRCYLKMLDKE
jgi:ribosomal protein S18 acetylase RimI-like enzyme